MKAEYGKRKFCNILTPQIDICKKTNLLLDDKICQHRRKTLQNFQKI